MGKAQRDKGARRERQIVDAHRALGVRAERVPLSGAMRFRNTEKSDVDVYVFGAEHAPCVTEVKARATGGGFKTIKDWLGENDALFLIEDRQMPLVVLPWKTYQNLLLTVQGRQPVFATKAVETNTQEVYEAAVNEMYGDANE